MTYDITTLTENQVLLLNGIHDAQFSEGPEFGAWYDDVVTQAFEKGIIKTKQQTKATLNQLIRKKVLDVDTTKEEGASWLTLTVAGGDALAALQDASDEDAPDEDVAEDDDDEDLLGDTGAIEIVPAAAPEEDEEEDLLGVEAAEVETISDSITQEQVVSHTENYTVNEWTDADDTEWTETIFADGSHTLRRRRKVSDSWRTDYWGAEFSGDKEKATTAKLCKMARAAGHFNHTPHAADAA
jgi:hypothetical protein